jgi:AcrR family transcriptional regulator
MEAPDRVNESDRGQRRATFQRSGSRETKRALTRSAVALWRVQGYETTTIADICRAAGVSKGLFYFYFQRKEDLLYELGVLSTESLLREAEARSAAGATLHDILRAMLTAFERAMRPNPPELVVASLLEGYRREEEARAGASLRIFDGVVAHAVATGELPASVDADRLAGLMQTLLTEGARHWASGFLDGRPFVEEVLTNLELVVAGAVSRSG